MLNIKNLIITNLKGTYFLNDFSFSLDIQDKVGLIGEEGNGKSTLLKAIYNKKDIEHYTQIKGTIDKGKSRIGYFEQRLDSKWDDFLIYEYLLKDDIEGCIEPEKYKNLYVYEKLCGELNLSNDFIHKEQTIKTLSGGERVKLQLLKLLYKDPDILLLDEPTNDLDIETLVWLENFIVELSFGCIFISHDETLLTNCSNRIIHLEQLNKKTRAMHTISNQNYANYIEERYHKREKDIQLANKEKTEYKKKKIKLNNIQNAVHDALNDTVRNPGSAALLKKKMRNVKSQEKRFEKEGYSVVDSIEESINVFFEPMNIHEHKIILDYYKDVLSIDDRVLINDISLYIQAKDKVAIIGNNGCGKSLLIKELYNVLRNRNDIQLGYMPQNYLEAFDDFETPIAFLLDKGDLKDLSRVRTLLGAMKFTREEMLQALNQLSEGQKAKIYLLKFIKDKCNVLLLDEPTRNFSPLSLPIIREILINFQGCIISVTHDRKYLEKVCDQVYEIENNQFIKISK